jgi:O-antigen/teichoic acid export membrane protein
LVRPVGWWRLPDPEVDDFMTKTVLKAESVRASKVSESDQNIILAAKGGGIAFVGNLFVFFFRFLFGLVLARLLGAELMGLYSLSTTITDMTAVIAEIGIGAGVVRFVSIAIGQKDKAKLWGVIQTGLAVPVVTSVLLAIGVFVLAEPIALGFFHRPDLIPVLRMGSLGIPFTVLIAVQSSITQAFKHMEYKVYGEDITLNLLKLVLTVVFLVIGFGVVGVALAHNISLLVVTAMFFLFVNKLFSLKRPLNTAKRNPRELFGFTLPLYLNQLLSGFSGSIESLILGSLGLVSGVGVYGTALRLSAVGMLFHRSLQRIAMPMISDLYDRREMGQLKRVYRTTTKWGMTFNLPIFLVIALFANPLLLIFGDEFVAGATGLIILAFANLFNASTGVCGSMITMTGHPKLTFANSVIYLVLNIALDVALIPLWGITGAALAVTLADLSINSLRTLQVYLLLRIWPYDWTFLKPAAAALLATGVTLLVRSGLASIPWLLQLAAGALVLVGLYAAAIVLLGLSQEDHLVLDRLWARFRLWRS